MIRELNHKFSLAGSYSQRKPLAQFIHPMALNRQRAAAFRSTRNTKAKKSYYFRTIFTVLVVTAVYTLFLYRSGACRLLIVCWFFCRFHTTRTPSDRPSFSHTTILIGGASSFLGSMAMAPMGRRTLQVSTWNIAAINNNPFEYWITYDEEPAYEKLMVKVEELIENPDARDVKVSDGVFTQAMFEKLNRRLTDTAGWTSMETYWREDYSQRSFVSEFLKDETLGAKRLASMPDRVTNIINTADGKSVFRPSVISMYDGDLSSQDVWYDAWEKFMFDDALDIKDPKTGQVNQKAPYALLKSIAQKKYPAITDQEEIDSLPLQTLCGAIFDAILVHMMNTLSESPTIWQELKRTMVKNLNLQKVPHTLDILQNEHYKDSDIITLQEVSSAFVDMAKDTVLQSYFQIVTPRDADPVRDQNSVIFLSKSTFDVTSVVEITGKIKTKLPENMVGNGDVLAITVKTKDGKEKFVIASFHGDTNGLQTIPVTDAVIATVQESYRDHRLIFGLDANTYEHGTPDKKQDVTEYASHIASQGLSSCWGSVVNPSNYTTYNARTYLQTQLNKACKSTEKRIKGDVNPKDFILFGKDQFGVVQTWKDNTGKKRYIEETAFPTLEFPSDHGILATILEYKD